MMNLQKLLAKRDQLQAHVIRLSGDPKDATSAVANHFHLGMVGGSGRNVRALNRKRERALDARINRAVDYMATMKALKRVEAAIEFTETEPARKAARERGKLMLEQRGKFACSDLKAGDQVRWLVTGNPLTVIRVNRTSVTVQMGAGEERLRFEEVSAL